MNNNKRTIQMIAGGFLILLLLVGAFVVPPLFQKPERVDITMLSGELLSDTFREYFEENGYYVNNIKEGAFNYHASENLSIADCVAPGSASAVKYFAENKPADVQILETYVHSRTYGVLYTREDIQLPWLLKAGLVELAPDGHYTTDSMLTFLNAIKDDLTWLELFEQAGLNIPKSQQEDWMYLQFNVTTSAPEGSSGGRSSYYYFGANFASQYKNGVIEALDLDDVPLVIDDMLAVWNEQEMQNTHSVHFFFEFMDKSKSWGMAFSTESLYVGWWNGMTDAERADALKRPIVGIYPKITMSSEHSFIALTPACQQFIDFTKNSDYIKGNNFRLLGFRTPGQFVDVTAYAPANWKLLEDVVAIDEPKYPVTQVIDPEFKK